LKMIRRKIKIVYLVKEINEKIRVKRE